SAVIRPSTGNDPTHVGGREVGDGSRLVEAEDLEGLHVRAVELGDGVAHLTSGFIVEVHPLDDPHVARTRGGNARREEEAPIAVKIETDPSHRAITRMVVVGREKMDPARPWQLATSLALGKGLW